jgi:hypothetical protein
LLRPSGALIDIEHRTGEASVIVAADGLTASDSVSCQLNLEHIHDRQPGTRASLRGLSRANSRHGEPVSTRPTWELVSATDVPAETHERRDNRCSISTPAVPPLGAARGRADPRLLHGSDGNAGIPLSAHNQRGLPSGPGPPERRSALLGL